MEVWNWATFTRTQDLRCETLVGAPLQNCSFERFRAKSFFRVDGPFCGNFVCGTSQSIFFFFESPSRRCLMFLSGSTLRTKCDVEWKCCSVLSTPPFRPCFSARVHPSLQRYLRTIVFEIQETHFVLTTVHALSSHPSCQDRSKQLRWDFLVILHHRSGPFWYPDTCQEVFALNAIRPRVSAKVFCSRNSHELHARAERGCRLKKRTAPSIPNTCLFIRQVHDLRNVKVKLKRAWPLTTVQMCFDMRASKMFLHSKISHNSTTAAICVGTHLAVLVAAPQVSSHASLLRWPGHEKKKGSNGTLHSQPLGWSRAPSIKCHQNCPSSASSPLEALLQIPRHQPPLPPSRPEFCLESPSCVGFVVLKGRRTSAKRGFASSLLASRSSSFGMICLPWLVQLTLPHLKSWPCLVPWLGTSEKVQVEVSNH